MTLKDTESAADTLIERNARAIDLGTMASCRTVRPYQGRRSASANAESETRAFDLPCDLTRGRGELAVGSMFLRFDGGLNG